MLLAESKREQCSKICLRGRRGSWLAVCEWDWVNMTLTHKEVCVLNPQMCL